MVACHGLWRVCLMPSQPACGWPPVYRTSCRRCADAGCRAYRRHDSNVIALRLDRQHHSVGVHTESPIHTLMQASHDDDAVPAKRQGRWGMIKASFRRTGRASSRKNTHNEPAASGKLSDPALAYPASQAAGCGHATHRKMCIGSCSGSRRLGCPVVPAQVGSGPASCLQHVSQPEGRRPGPCRVT